MNLRRQLPTLAENLKAQFGMIAEQVTSLNLASRRGASENQRVRTLREGVAQVKQAIEIAVDADEGQARGEGRQGGPASERRRVRRARVIDA